MKRRVHSRLFTGTLGSAAALMAFHQAEAQEALTASRGASQAAKARSQTAQNGGYANTGSSFGYNLGAGLAFQYNDNVNLSQSNAEDEFSVRPSISAGAYWTITDYTRLGLDMKLGWIQYLNDSSRSRLDFGISPSADNNIGFEILLGDWHINIYDSFGVRSDPVRDGTISNTDKVVQFDNTIGALASYDLGNSQLNAGYAFRTSLFQDSKYSNSDRNSHLFNAGYQYSFNPAVTVGIESSASLSVYNSGNQNDSTVYTLGPSLQWIPTEFITIIAGGGPSLVTYSANNAGYRPSDRSTYYLYSTINHRFSEFASHSLSINQSVAPTVQSSQSETLSFNYTLSLNIIRDVRLTAGVFYETGRFSSGIVPSSAQFTRVGGRLEASRSFGDHLSAGLAYEFTHRDSDTANTNYDQNRVTLSASYRF
jgi:hypothetical protein